MEKTLVSSQTLPVASAGRRAFIAKLALASLAATPALVLGAEPAKPGAKPAKPAPPAPSAGRWLTDYKRAADEAKKFNKLLLLNFTGSDWCGWCMRLDKYVFNTSEFKKYARENLVLLTVDFPHQKRQSAAEKSRNAELKREYEVKEFPSVIVLNSEGEKIGKFGFKKQWTEWMESSKDQPKIAKDCISTIEEMKDGGPDGASAMSDIWLTDYAAAVKKAKAEKKRLLLNFTGSDWCGWCMRLDQETFSTKAFRDYAKSELVLVKLDFPHNIAIPEATKKQNAQLQKKHQVRGFPSCIVLSPEEAVLTKIEGYCKRVDFMIQLKSAGKNKSAL